MSGPVEGGTVVGLTCRTRGARPAAWITWYNGSAPFAETPTDDVALMVSKSNYGPLAKVYLRNKSAFSDRNSETTSDCDNKEGNKELEGCGR